MSNPIFSWNAIKVILGFLVGIPIMAGLLAVTSNPILISAAQLILYSIFYTICDKIYVMVRGEF